MFILEKPDKNLSGDITLPASKSISNRLLIIRALSPRPFRINNLSCSDDTKVLEDALSSGKEIVNIGHAGTSMRFLTGYFAINPGERILTGSARMKKRPIGELINALKTLGADIQYIENEGFPPLRIKGKQIEGGKITINSGISSQFISTLLMIAPVLKKGLELHLTGKVVSPSYIQLTLKLMQLFGIKHEWKGSVIIIHNQVYKPDDITVEADWSSASYWYEMAALAEKADLMIRGLSQSGLQGDSVLSELFEKFGVKTEFTEGAVRLTGKPKVLSRFDYDFIDQPDLVQTFAVLCALRGIPFRLEGTQTLRVKETDRVHALKQELAKFGIRLDSAADGSWIEYNGTNAGLEIQLYGPNRLAHGTKSRVQGPEGKAHKAEKTIKIRTYQDHRMAMAFTPAAMQGYRIDIDNPGVVSKSYPGFWEDIKKAGFRIIFSH